MAKKPPKVPVHRNLLDTFWRMSLSAKITFIGALFGVFIGIPTAVTTWNDYIYPVMPAFHFQVDKEIGRLERHIKKLEDHLKIQLSGDQ
jgi:hypothetical protein